MAWPGYLSLFFTVVLLVTTTYFLLGGLPLLVLQHDTPMDGRFVRRFFEIYYKALFAGAVGACISYALWGRWFFALGGGGIALVALALRRRVIPAMQRLGEAIQCDDRGAITAFRRVHAAALSANLLQLVLLVWAVLRITI
ncbi:hypothetical protein AACH10_14060 [Ideonella sp. DXS22W]|uniref:DUF4149 domain-containing protein n=1 Tax=Pseudaquabacterium inlustre TaxID=2984192 RepID=A0ABU9CHN7_9BURK